MLMHILVDRNIPTKNLEWYFSRFFLSLSFLSLTFSLNIDIYWAQRESYQILCHINLSIFIDYDIYFVILLDYLFGSNLDPQQLKFDCQSVVISNLTIAEYSSLLNKLIVKSMLPARSWWTAIRWWRWIEGISK